MKHRVLLVLLLTLTCLSGVHAISFPEWQFAQFSQAELLNPAVSGANANPAGDGLSNWLKYVFDLNPHAACIEGAPAPQMVGGALALNFFRRTDYPYLIYALEASPDLSHWSWRNSYQPSAVTSLGAVTQWTVVDPYQWPAGGSKFLRLRVESGDPGTWILTPPNNLTARTVRLPFGLELRWSDRSNAEIGYRVERQRIADNVWDLFAITGQDTISYFDYTVQSGVAYAYRVCAMFPGGVLSGWTESGTVTPGGGGSGGGGPGPGDPGGGDPGPDPDTDGDTFKDSVDAYPHDKRRSRDLPTLTYAEIDISTAIIGAKDVNMIALDDQNQVAFSYSEAASGSTPESLKVVVWKDGAQVGSTSTFPLRASASWNPPPDWQLYPAFLNAAGTIAGNATQSRPARPAVPPAPVPVFESKSCAFTQSVGGAPAFLHGRWSAHSSDPCIISLGGLTGTGLVWGEQRNSYMSRRATPAENSFDFIGSTTIPFLTDPARPAGQNGPEDYGADLGPKFAPELVNLNQHATGRVFNQTAPYRYTGGEPAELAGQRACALGDDGTIFGIGSGLPPEPGLPTDALTPYFWPVTGGNATNVSTSLPAEFRKQISFNLTTAAQLNSVGDLLFATDTLEGSEDKPVWNRKDILWTRQTSTANPNGTLAVVTNPGSGLNKDRLMVGLKQKYPINPTTGEEDTTQTAYMAAVLKVPVEFVTKGPNSEFLPQSVTWNSVVPPQIEVTAASATYAANTLTVSVAGKVTDATSDCTPTPGKQVATLFITGAPAEAQVTLNNTANPVATDPWRPYKYEATFTHNLTIPITGPGNYAVRLRTSENAGGLAGSQEVNIHVQASDLTQDVQLQLPASFSPAQADTITMTMGVAPATETVTLTETGDATHIFSGQRGSGMVTLAFAQTPALTAAVDNLSATLTKSLSGQTVSSIPLAFVETGATTNAFNVQPPANPSYDVTTSSGGSAAPGNFYPTIVRFPAGIGQSMIAAGYKITIMEHDWSLKLKTYQGQEYAYVVDDNDKPVVFNPSLYAQTDIQTKKLNNGKFPLTIKGPNGEKLGGKDEMLSVASGLLIYGPTGATAKGYLNSKLTHLAEPTYPRVLGRAEGASLYSPEKGQDLGHLDNDVETEIVWRYVNTTDTVVIFNSYQEMQKDIEYRKTLCNLVQTKIDPEFGISDAANGEKWNSAAGAATLNYGPRNGITWRSALEDVFIEHFDESNTLVQKYLLGCQSTAACLHLLAYMNTFGEAAFMQQIGKATPKGFRGDPSDNRLLDFTAYTYVVPQQGDNRAHWIPGDWGYIRNAHPPAGDDGTHAGEHIIYVGGCFIKTYTQFQNNALFFGHRLPSDNYQPGQTHKPRIIKTLGEWIGAFADASPTGNQSTVKQP